MIFLCGREGRKKVNMNIKKWFMGIFKKGDRECGMGFLSIK